jgi:hypothetical protein
MNPSVATLIRQQNGLIWQMGKNAQFARMYFNYHVDFATIASGVALTQSLTTQSDSHFLCHAVQFYAKDLTTNARLTGATAPDSVLQINDTGSGANWYDGNLQLCLIAGDGTLPGILVPPRLVKPAATLSLTITNNQSTNAQKYQIVLLGEKIFDFTGND